MSLETEIKDTVRAAVLEALRDRNAPLRDGSAPGDPDPLQLLTTEEVAELIRYSAEGVRDQIHTGKMKALMTGAGWRVKRIWLEEWMVAQGAGSEGVAAPDPDEEARRTVLAIREKRRR